MTDIDVPDWVTRAAEEARVNCLNAVTAYGSAGVEERYHMAMKAALRAALSAWVVPESVQFQDPDGGRWWNFSSTEGNDCATSLGWPKRTLYALRQEKPE